MKSNIAQISSIYGPLKKPRTKSVLNSNQPLTKIENSNSKISLSSKKQLLIKKDPSIRNLPMKKRRDSHSYNRRDSKSVEPLPAIKAHTPIPSTSPTKPLKISLYDNSLDEEMIRLDSLITKNYSARSDLLMIQNRILSLGVHNILRNRRFMSICDVSENVSFEQIDESLRDISILKIGITENRRSLGKLKLPPLSSL